MEGNHEHTSSCCHVTTAAHSVSWLVIEQLVTVTSVKRKLRINDWKINCWPCGNLHDEQKQIILFFAGVDFHILCCPGRALDFAVIKKFWRFSLFKVHLRRILFKLLYGGPRKVDDVIWRHRPIKGQHGFEADDVSPFYVISDFLSYILHITRRIIRFFSKQSNYETEHRVDVRY